MARTRSLYRLIRPLLFRLNPEASHRLTIALLSAAGRFFAAADDPPELHTNLWGLDFCNPVGLAAGADKDARAVLGWAGMGFGFAELGTITPRPQRGNPRPRMWRLERERALINRLGFPGAGMYAAKVCLERARASGLRMRIGLNFGPNKNTAPDQVAEDYAALAVHLGPLAEFIVLNVSSPNTPGLREWQAPERIGAIVDAIRAALTGTVQIPLLIKISPDLQHPMLAQLCAAAMDLRIDGIVATNTTLERERVGVSSSYQGGLSGEPLKLKSRAIIAEAFKQLDGRIPIIGVGGISSAEDAYEHIRAGASLVELYTGMIYEGVGVVGAIKRGLTRLLVRDGFRSVSEAVGTATR
jgi:dihydroorotate dehydrogenase